jgi:glycogen synthase
MLDAYRTDRLGVQFSAGMARDFGWRASAAKHMRLYQSAIERSWRATRV